MDGSKKPGSPHSHWVRRRASQKSLIAEAATRRTPGIALAYVQANNSVFIMDIGSRRTTYSGMRKILAIGSITILIYCVAHFVPPCSMCACPTSVSSKASATSETQSSKLSLPLFGDGLSQSFQDQNFVDPTFDPFKHPDAAMGTSTSQFGQDHYAWNNFFYHLHQGTFLEIGGHDGMGSHYDRHALCGCAI